MSDDGGYKEDAHINQLEDEQREERELIRHAGAVPAVQLSLPQEMSVQQMVERVAKIKAIAEAVMVENVDYGTIPGTPKPTLYKAGAEKLCMAFMLAPMCETVVTALPEPGHREYTSTCTLVHYPSGRKIVRVSASCSTMEVKYRWRQAARKCPKCGKPAIIKGSEQYGGGWVCWRKREGCGAKFPDGDVTIEKQVVGRVANEDLADTYNTVRKMNEKRALVAASLIGTCASMVYTQDLEDGGNPDEETGGSDGSGARADSTDGTNSSGTSAAATGEPPGRRRVRAAAAPAAASAPPPAQPVGEHIDRSTSQERPESASAPQGARPGALSVAQVEEAKGLVAKSGQNEKFVLKMFGVKDYSELTAAQVKVMRNKWGDAR